MAMREYEELKNIQIPKEQEEIMDIFTAAWEECLSCDCMDCPDRLKKEMQVMACLSLKTARLLVEAGYRRSDASDLRCPIYIPESGKEQDEEQPAHDCYW